MKLSLSIVVITALVIISSLVGESSAEVRPLTGANYTSFMESRRRGVTIATFCSSFLHHCSRFHTVLTELDIRYASSPNIAVGYMDSELHYEYMDELEIDDLPAIIVRRHGIEHRFVAEPTMWNIMTFLDFFTEDVVSELSTEREVRKFVRGNATVTPVIMYVNDADLESDVLHSFGLVAHDRMWNSEFRFAFTHVASLLNAPEGVEVKTGTVAGFPYFENKPRFETLGPSQQDVTAYLRTIAAPAYGNTSDNRFATRMHLRDLPTVHAYVNDKKDADTLKRLAASDLGKRFTFAATPATNMAEATVFGLSGEVVPSLYVEVVFLEWQYTYEEVFTYDAIREFLLKVEKKEAQHFIKSEPIPEGDAFDHGFNMTRAVGYTVRDLFLHSPTRYVIMLLETGLCGMTCNISASNLNNRIRPRMKNVTDVRFLVFDPTQNAVPLNLLHDFVYPGYLIRDNVKNITTTTSGRKITAKALDHMLNDIMELEPLTDDHQPLHEENDPYKQIPADCVSSETVHVHLIHNQRMDAELTRLRSMLVSKEMDAEKDLF